MANGREQGESDKWVGSWGLEVGWGVGSSPAGELHSDFAADMLKGKGGEGGRTLVLDTADNCPLKTVITNISPNPIGDSRNYNMVGESYKP